MSSEFIATRRLLKQTIRTADKHRQAGHLAQARDMLDRLAEHEDIAALGQMTSLGLPRKLVSAQLKLAKAEQDAVRRVGYQYHLVPDPALLAPYCRFDSAQRRDWVRAQSTAVPQCLHQVWIGDAPVPAGCAAWQAQAARTGFDYRLWREQDLQTLGTTQLPLYQRLVAAGNLPGAVDVARYHILHRLGGIYLDCDWFPARQDQSLADRLPMSGLGAMAETVPRHTGRGSLLLANSVLAAPPAHPVFERLLDILDPVFDALPEAPVWWSTGPLIFTQVCRAGPVSLADADLVAGSLPQATPLEQVMQWCRESQAGDGGPLLLWKSWIWNAPL